MSDLSVVSKIVLLITCMSFISLMLPTSVQFITGSGLAIFGASTVGVAAFCVVTTGVPCAIALGVSVGVQFAAASGLLAALGFVAVSSVEWIGSLILTPISIILSVFIAKLGRGAQSG